MQFDAVFFDSGGTLWDDPAPGAVPPGRSLREVHDRRGRRLAAVMASLGYPVTAEQVEAALGDLERDAPGRFGPAYTYTDLVAALAEASGLPLRAEDALLCADAYVGPRYADCLFPGVERTLKALTDAGVHVGLISNTYIPGLIADRLFQAVGLLKYLRTRICSGDEGLSKPDPEIFRLAERHAGLAGRRILYVGDKYSTDVAPAHAAGWAAALRRSARTSPADLAGADFAFDALEDLLPFVLGRRRGGRDAWKG